MKNFKLKKLVAVALTVMAIATVSPVGVSAAWKQDSNGWWNTEGTSYSTGWKTIDNNWYYFGSDGYMKTGWVNDGGKWYYTAPSGAMQTGWLSNNGAWYYLNTSGDMKTGLVEVNNKTYYLSESGAMKTGNVTVNGVNYSFATSGEKINTTESKPVDTTPTTAPNTTVSSGGSGGGSGASNSPTNATGTTYKDLYGNWVVGKYLGSKLDKDVTDLLVGQEFTISKDSVSSAAMTITNPNVKQTTIKSSDIEEKYKVDISGDTVDCITLSDNESKESVKILVTDNGTYAVARGELFELNK